MASEPTPEMVGAALAAWMRSVGTPRENMAAALAAALAVQAQERASRKQCACRDETYRAVLAGGTCGMGGCPHGGDF